MSDKNPYQDKFSPLVLQGGTHTNLDNEPEVGGTKADDTSMGVADVWTSGLYQGMPINLVYEVPSLDSQGNLAGPALRLSYPSTLKTLVKAIGRIDKVWYRMTLLRDFARFKMDQVTGRLGTNYAANAAARVTEIKERVTKAQEAAKKAAEKAAAVTDKGPAPTLEHASTITMQNLNGTVLANAATAADNVAIEADLAESDVYAELRGSGMVPLMQSRMQLQFKDSMVPLRHEVDVATFEVRKSVGILEKFQALPAGQRTPVARQAAQQALTSLKNNQYRLQAANTKIIDLKQTTQDTLHELQEKQPDMFKKVTK